jgi:hypothetical protein
MNVSYYEGPKVPCEATGEETVAMWLQLE